MMIPTTYSTAIAMLIWYKQLFFSFGTKVGVGPVTIDSRFLALKEYERLMFEKWIDFEINNFFYWLNSGVVFLSICYWTKYQTAWQRI